MSKTMRPYDYKDDSGNRYENDPWNLQIDTARAWTLHTYHQHGEQIPGTLLAAEALMAAEQDCPLTGEYYITDWFQWGEPHGATELNLALYFEAFDQSFAMIMGVMTLRKLGLDTDPRFWVISTAGDFAEQLKVDA